jgi:ribonuclease HII
MGAGRFQFERALLAAGVTAVAGVDEAGRGPLAGPVVAAAVMFPPAWVRDGLPRTLHGLNDSKQLSPAAREAFFTVLTARPEIAWAIAEADAAEIDRVNILRATHAAMVRALAALPRAPAHVLVDGTRVAAIGGPQTPLVRGDARSYSIAAASVLAKVTRDRLMTAADARWPGYGFAMHKGYPVPAHLAALARLGPCPLHRRSFAPVRAAQAELFPPAGAAQ